MHAHPRRRSHATPRRRRRRSSRSTSSPRTTDRPLTSLPFSARRKALEARVPARDTPRDRAARRVGALREASRRRSCSRAHAREEFESILLKRIDAPYVAGKRTPGRKGEAVEREQELVIGGYSAPTEGGQRSLRRAARRLLRRSRCAPLRRQGRNGVHRRDARAARAKARAAPSSGVAVRRRAPSRRDRDNFGEAGARRAGALRRMTDAGILRQPRFLGLRDDKAARDVHPGVHGERRGRRHERAALCLVIRTSVG